MQCLRYQKSRSAMALWISGPIQGVKNLCLILERDEWQLNLIIERKVVIKSCKLIYWVVDKKIERAE